MAEIRTLLMLRHLRSEPTSHVLLFKRGAQKRSARGASFWFAPLGASIAEVPLEDRELPFLVHARSADFQDVNVNGAIIYRVTDPELLASRFDFSIDTASGRFRGEPLDQLTSVVVERAQELAGGFLARAPLRELLDQRLDVLRDEIHRGLTTDPGLASLGLAIVATRVTAFKPSPEVERALQMPARERIQQAADEATFARRALAVDKERAIEENELNNRIELARREEELIARQGHNEKKRVTDQTEARAIEARAAAARTRLEAEAQAEAIRVTEEAQVGAERERIEIYRDLSPSVMMGLAARELAGKLESIEHLNLTPDLLGSLLQRVLGAQAQRLEDGAG